MNWNQVEQVFLASFEDLRGRTNNRPFTKHSGPLVGGIGPTTDENVEIYYIEPPKLISAGFIIKLRGKNPAITIKGNAMRPVRERPSAAEALATMLVPVDFAAETFQIKTGQQQKEWSIPTNTELIPGERRYLRMDPGLKIRVFTTIGKQENDYSVLLNVRNTATRKQSVLYDFDFTIELVDCELVRPKAAYQSQEQDIPRIVETVGAIADVDNNKIYLKHSGIWDQERVVTVTGPTFTEALKKPFDGNLNKYHDKFEWASKITTTAMQKLVAPSNNYHKFQYDLRGIIYKKLVQGWEDNILRSVINNAPTASGKSETNYDTAVVATLVRKALTPDKDCGTVAVITEPIRALTAEQFERLFKYLAFVNEQLEDDMKITMGFFMGTHGTKGIPYEPGPDITIKQVPINDCPFCSHQLQLEHRANVGRLVPKCSNCGKDYPWICLTLLETEQILPNIVVATLDKLCYDIGRDLSVHTFFGREYVRCTKASCNRAISVTSRVVKGNGECRFCSSPTGAVRKRSKISIFVLDEAHTFRGNLGSNAGLYTTSELKLARNVLSESPLVIASTATIKKAGELMLHLTGSIPSETVIVPDPSKDEMTKYFKPTNDLHRKFVFLCANASNRVAIPRAIGTIKDAYDKVRGKGDPEHLPQIVFTKKRQNADNLNNAVSILGVEDQHNLLVRTVHGEHPKSEVMDALRQVENNEIDVLFVTLDLIALGIDIPSISVVHFDGMPEDFAKFVQAYSRSARGQRGNDCGLVITWLRMNIPGEAYYFEHFRDLFIYQDQLMPIVPINRWFPQSIRSYMPAAAMQYGFFTDENASMFSPAVTARRLTREEDFTDALRGFLVNEVLSDSTDPADKEIAKRNTMLGLQNLQSHIPRQNLNSLRSHKQLLEGILPRGIRSQSKETTISPRDMDRTLMSIRVERVLISAGFSEYELGLGEDED